MTQPLYLEDAYMKEFEANVIETKEFDGNKLVILDKTAFYPGGGGQPNDTGKFIQKGKEIKVIAVYKYGGEIFHVVEEFPEKGNIKGVIDWERRYILMRMHTAAHLLSAIIGDEEHALITGGQLGVEKSRIDLSIEGFSKEKVLKYIEKANELIKEGREVKAYVLPREEALKIPTVSRLAKGLNPDLKEIRIVEIEGIDKQADGGLHVKNIKEIGKIELIKIDNKGKNNKRIYFKVI